MRRTLRPVLIKRRSGRGSQNIVRVLVWLGVTVLVAGFVAANVPHDKSSSTDSLLTPARDRPRETTQLTRQNLRPTLSSQGVVVRGASGYEIRAPLSEPDLAYQLISRPSSVKALIIGGPVGFNCRWLGLRADGNSPAIACAVPTSVRVVAGLQGTIVLGLRPPRSAVVLPLTAVIGSALRGQVIVVGAHRVLHTRDVALGESDSQWIEIRGGLRFGEQVLAVPVQSDLSGG